MHKRKYVISILTALALALTLGFPASAGEMSQKLAKQSTVEQIIKRGVLRVGFSTFIPWAMKNKEGKFVGFETDVATKLAKDMGVKLELVPTKWSGIIPALLTGKFDVIIGGMGIRPQRALKVNFTVPYDYSGMSMGGPQGKSQGICQAGGLQPAFGGDCGKAGHNRGQRGQKIHAKSQAQAVRRRVPRPFRSF